jgi:hypothetical protein
MIPSLLYLRFLDLGILAMQPNGPFWAYPNLNKILWREMRYDSACLLAIELVIATVSSCLLLFVSDKSLALEVYLRYYVQWTDYLIRGLCCL